MVLTLPWNETNRYGSRFLSSIEEDSWQGGLCPKDITGTIDDQDYYVECRLSFNLTIEQSEGIPDKAGKLPN